MEDLLHQVHGNLKLAVRSEENFSTLNARLSRFIILLLLADTFPCEVFVIANSLTVDDVLIGRIDFAIHHAVEFTDMVFIEQSHAGKVGSVFDWPSVKGIILAFTTAANSSHIFSHS